MMCLDGALNHAIYQIKEEAHLFGYTSLLLSHKTNTRPFLVISASWIGWILFCFVEVTHQQEARENQYYIHTYRL